MTTAAATVPAGRGLGVRVAQLVVSCVVLGIGAGLLLSVRLGSDGYSTMLNGLARWLDVPFVAVNTGVGLVLIVMAWWRGVIPGVGTVVQWIVVGVVVTATLELVPEPPTPALRLVVLAVAFVVLTVGVAGYLDADLGMGPTEAAAVAWDPPVPFKWSYSIVQGGGTVIGWLAGADIGIGTVVVMAFLGHAVDRVAAVLPGTRAHRVDTSERDGRLGPVDRRSTGT